MRPILAALALLADDPLAAAKKPVPALSPTEIVEAAPKADWTAIAPSDLLVMELAADAKGRAGQSPRCVLHHSSGRRGHLQYSGAGASFDRLTMSGGEVMGFTRRHEDAVSAAGRLYPGYSAFWAHRLIGKAASQQARHLRVFV